MTPADELLARLDDHAAVNNAPEDDVGQNLYAEAAARIRSLIAERDGWKIKWADARSAEVEAKRELEAGLAETERLREKAIIGEYMWTPAELHEALTTAREEGRREGMEEAARILERAPSFGDGKWAARIVRELIPVRARP